MTTPTTSMSHQWGTCLTCPEACKAVKRCIPLVTSTVSLQGDSCPGLPPRLPIPTDQGSSHRPMIITVANHGGLPAQGISQGGNP